MKSLRCYPSLNPVFDLHQPTCVCCRIPCTKVAICGMVIHALKEVAICNLAGIERVLACWYWDTKCLQLKISAYLNMSPVMTCNIKIRSFACGAWLSGGHRHCSIHQIRWVFDNVVQMWTQCLIFITSHVSAAASLAYQSAHRQQRR